MDDFQPKRAYKARAYNKKSVIGLPSIFWSQVSAGEPSVERFNPSARLMKGE